MVFILISILNFSERPFLSNVNHFLGIYLERIYYYNHFTDSHIDVVLFAGNYFNENPLKEENTILLPDGYLIHLLFYLICTENLQ